MSARSLILNEMHRIAAEQNKVVVVFRDETPLLTVGLDSFCFAILVARLEEAFDVDPFGSSEEAELPITVGDFIRLYEGAVETKGHEKSPSCLIPLF